MKEAKGRPDPASRIRFHDCERMVDYVSVCGKFSGDDEKPDPASACKSGWILTRGGWIRPSAWRLQIQLDPVKHLEPTDPDGSGRGWMVLCGVDQLEMAGFYSVAATVATCHEFGGGGSGHGMIKSELQMLQAQ